MYHLRFALMALLFMICPFPGVALRLPPATGCQASGLFVTSKDDTEGVYYPTTLREFAAWVRTGEVMLI